jgi:hypothetical protein
MNWQSPARRTQNMGPSDAIVVKFTTGNVSSISSLPRITGAEYQSPPSSRIAVLSPTACDFGTQPMMGAYGEGNSITMVFAVGTGSGYGFYPVIPLNTTWYLNVKNSPNSTCTAGGVCEMFFDLLKPGGM